MHTVNFNAKKTVVSVNAIISIVSIIQTITGMPLSADTKSE